MSIVWYSLGMLFVVFTITGVSGVVLYAFFKEFLNLNRTKDMLFYIAIVVLIFSVSLYVGVRSLPLL